MSFYLAGINSDSIYLKRFQLDSSVEYVDLTVFCSDVGWRKPAAPIFHYVLDSLHLTPNECVFIGDNPKWDVLGPNNANIDAILIDRNNIYADSNLPRIKNLNALFQYI